MTVRRRDPNSKAHVYNHLPVTLFPSPVNRQCFNEAIAIQIPINQMMNKIGNDTAFVEEVLGDLIKVDDFTEKLLNISQTVRKEGQAAEHALGIFRSDYIIDSHNVMKQVEVNAISVSFAGLAPSVADFHRYTLQNFQNLPSSVIEQMLPENSSLKDVAQALVDAHAVYGKAEAAILVVVEEEVVNIMDQKLIEWTVKKANSDIKLFRRTFHQLDAATCLGPNKELLLRVQGHLNTVETVELAVVYFRTAYAPADFVYENAWSVRLLLERSKAIKCPAIHFQLAGVKKFQSVLCSQDILARYIEPSEPAMVAKVWNTFAQFYPANQSSLALATASPSAYVLKPNREGGGNNYFDAEIPEMLQSIVGTEQEDAYTLMEYINQPPMSGLILRPDVPLEAQHQAGAQIKTELGVYGTILSSNSTSGGGGVVVFNRNAGHLLRAKAATSNETGIMAGAGAIDSPWLVDN